jgi:hypothetical protein
MAYDGGVGATVGGASFGDTYKFATLAAAPEQVTRASGWRYNEANTISYAMQWTDPAQVDAEMGHVATLPIGVKDQGSDPRTYPVVDVRNTQQLNGPMIDDEHWAYQILNYVMPANGPTGSKRLTWGSNWGLPGGFDNYGDNSLNVRQYSQHATSTLGHAYNGTRADGMLLAYSVFVVLGTHSGGYQGGTVGQTVTQMENSALATLAAVTGTVKTSGPAGVGNAASATVTYTPAGYNGVYSTWELVAAGNSIDATLTPAAGKSLDHPIFVVNGYTLGQLPTTISVGNGLATPDVDYFATLDTAQQRLWITVNRSASSAVNLKVTASGGAQPPVISSIPASGTIGTSIIITGNTFSGATAVTFNGASASFTVNSATQITAVVPAGATTGPIAVTTPGGTAASATNFTPLSPQSGTIPGTFQQMDTDDGGWFTGLAVHPSGRLYGRTDVGGVYRSDDHGDSWTYLSGDMTSYTAHCVQGIAIAAGDPNVVYQCAGFAYGNSDQGIWKTTDGGATWTQVKSGIHFSGNDPERWGGECVAIRPGNDNQVWAGSRGDGLWRSTNAGANWSQLGAVVFAGAQFTSVSLPPAGRSDIWVGASGFSGPGGVWVSVNEGASWTLIAGTQGGVSAPEGCWRITREPNGKVLVAGGNGALGSVLYEFNATDWINPATYTWTDLSWPDINRSQDAPLVVALADGRIVAGSIFGGYSGGPASIRTQIRSLAGVWSPTDALNGAMPAWQRAPAPTLIEGGRNALVQDPINPNRWFMAGGYGPFRTTNGGASWQYIVNGIDEVVDYKVNFHPTDSSRVYLPMADHGGAVVLDGGASGAVSRYLTTRTLLFPDDLGLCHTILASGDRLLALGADERNNWRPRIFKSTDNGVTWSVLAPAGLPNQDNRCIISAVASRDNGDDILVALAGTDDGANGGGGVYRSANGGSTFVRTAGLPIAADYGDQFNPNAGLAADAADNNTRYLFLKNQGLYKSTDRGATWIFLNTGLPNYGVMAADTSLAGHLWVGTCCNQPVGLSRSTDGGATWTTVAGFISVTDVDAANDRVAVLGQRTGDTYDKIYYSGDSGGTWGEITRPGYRFGNAIAVALDPWRPGTVWISTNGRSVARFTPGVSNIAVVVQPNPSGQSITVDGTSYPTAQTFSWVPGSSHTIGTTSPQSGGTGIQYLWSNWSDGGALSHLVAPTASTSYLVNFTTQYRLDITINPPGSATLTANPAGPWYAPGQTVQLTVAPQAGFSLSSWTGVDASNGTTASVIMSAPRSLTVALDAVAAPPIIAAIPSSGAVGTSILITGNNFSGATAVTFNGTNSTFTIDSPTQITAVVPVGATAGLIAVTTPAGTATSAANFTPLSALSAPRLTLEVQTGLRIISGPTQYDRQNIATDTTAGDYGWIGAAATPVTYSLTISDFPAQAYQGFQAHVFLVPNSTGSIAPDYDEPNVVMLDVQAHQDGSASAWFRYKVNEASDNAFLYGDGTLGRVDCPTGPLGTWSVTFLNDIDIALTAPNGATLSLSFPDAATIQSAFGGKVAAYFGNQPNDVSQIGQATTFGRIRISGTPRAVAIDETFSGPDLNQHPVTVNWQWLKLAAAPADISVLVNTDGFVLSWTPPDPSYTLQFSPGLLPAAWADLILPNIITQGNSNIVNVSRTDLPGNTNGFFRMIKAPLSQPQDTDGDGIPDWWMLQYFGHATGQASDQSLASQNADGDGVSNLREYQRGTDPANAASVNAMLYVNSLFGNDGFNGLTPDVSGSQGPKLTIQGGIAAGVNGDNVSIAAGSYQQTLLDPGAKSIILSPQGEVTIH